MRRGHALNHYTMVAASSSGLVPISSYTVLAGGKITANSNGLDGLRNDDTVNGPGGVMHT